MQTRNVTIDIIKGIAIILMVIGHSVLGTVCNMIYLFHMAVFFICAGYCFNEKDCENLQGLIYKRIKSLYIPCLISNTIFVLLNNFLVNIYVIEGTTHSAKEIVFNLIKCILFSGGSPLSGVNWFLRTMFVVTIIYAIVQKAVKYFFPNHVIFAQTIISIVMVIIGFIGNIAPVGAKYFNVFTVYILLWTGSSLREFIYKWKDRINVSMCVQISVLLISTASLYYLQTVSRISLQSNNMVNPIFFMLSSIVGWICITAGAKLIERFSVHKVLIYLGKHTMPIMLLHFVSFKLITYLIIRIYDYDIIMLSSHPVIYDNSGWWIAYTFVGIIVPISLYELYKHVRKCLSNSICRYTEKK